MAAERHAMCESALSAQFFPLQNCLELSAVHYSRKNYIHMTGSKNRDARIRMLLWKDLQNISAFVKDLSTYHAE